MKTARYLTQERFDVLKEIYVGKNIDAIDAYGSECHDIGTTKGFISGIVCTCIAFIVGSGIGYVYDKVKRRRAIKKFNKELKKMVDKINEEK